MFSIGKISFIFGSKSVYSAVLLRVFHVKGLPPYREGTFSGMLWTDNEHSEALQRVEKIEFEGEI